MINSQTDFDYRQDLNRIFRESNPVTVVFIEFIFSFITMVILNMIFYYIYHQDYFEVIKRSPIFNFWTASFIYMICCMLHSYFLFIEADIQYNNKKYYYSIDEKVYDNIFSIPISISISFFFCTYLTITLLNINYNNNQSKDLFSSVENFVTWLIFFYFIPFLVVVFYNIIGKRKFLYYALNLWENFIYPFKDFIDNEINFANQNNTGLNLIILKSTNLKVITKKIHKRKKAIVHHIINNLNPNLKKSDILIPIDINKGVIGIISRRNQEELEKITTLRIIPFLENQLSLNHKLLNLKVDHQVINIGVMESIDTFMDIIKYSRSIVEQ